MHEVGQGPEPHNHFADIERLLVHGRCRQALNWLVDSRTGRIKSRFRCDLARAWSLAGIGYYRMGRPKKACTAFRRVLAQRPGDIDAMMGMAQCYDEMRKPRMAERYLRKALEVDTTRDDVLYNLGNALFDQGRFFEAATMYRRVSNAAAEMYGRARRNYQMALGSAVCT